jgi:hypothetical protein
MAAPPVHSARRHRFLSCLPLLLAALAAFVVAGCADDDDNGPPPGDAHIIVATTVAELDDALLNSVAGDTIEVRGEFSSSTFALTHNYEIPANRSPLRIVGIERTTFRPEIVFPAGVQGIKFVGHSGSSVANLDFRGGQDVIILSDSRVTLKDLNIRNNTRYGVNVSGNGSDGTVVDSCLFEHPGVFGVYDVGSADIVIQHNTIVNAGDCGLFIDANATIENNNIVDAANQGIHCDANAASPTLNCNNVFGSTNADYVCPTVLDILKNNFSLDPQFCPGTYAPNSASPLAPANSGACGLIGKLGVGCEPTP